ncbi:MAG: SPOR domain-containing protein [Nitrospirae bacterium YQR-1]
MKFGFFSKFDYNFIEGKGLLIAVIISFSSISFIIGFFAGKKYSGGEISQSAKKIGGFVVTEVKTLKETVPVSAPESETAVKDNQHSRDKEQEYAANQVLKAQQQQKNTKPEPPPATEKNLPETETVVVNREVEPKPQQQKQGKEHRTVKADSKPELKTAQKKQAQAKQKPVEEKPAKQTEEAFRQRYYIQVGAFKNVEEATRVQNDLKIKGFSASILKTPIKDGVTLYKVRVGDYNSQTEANAVLGRLSKKGFKCFMRGEPR